MDAATGLCAGCLRTLDEIAHWSRLPDELKRAVWAELPARRLRHPQLGQGAGGGDAGAKP